jgi:membrane-associated protease RseP (regulator of RpoE activity)
VTKKISCLLLVLPLAATMALAADESGAAAEKSGWLGVFTEDLSEPALTALGIEHGTLVAEVAEQSPAVTAGLKSGDIILAVGAEPVSDGSDLRRLVRGRPEQKVELTIRRQGKDQKVSVTLGARDVTERMFKFDWPELPKEAMREYKRVMREVGPGIRKGLAEYDLSLDSLRKEMDGLKKELEALRKQLQSKDKGN